MPAYTHIYAVAWWALDGPAWCAAIRIAVTGSPTRVLVSSDLEYRHDCAGTSVAPSRRSSNPGLVAQATDGLIGRRRDCATYIGPILDTVSRTRGPVTRLLDLDEVAY